MSPNMFFQILAGLALVFSGLAFAWRLRVFHARSRPADGSAPRGDAQAGLVYALTLGLAPWAKESTRRHWAAYLRGIGFHLGIFLGLALLLVSPWMHGLPGRWQVTLALATGLGMLFGLAGFAARRVEPNLKALSTLDDYFAVLLVSLFLGTATLWLLYAPALPFFYLAGTVMLVYAPLGKIRHCIYFAYSRRFFGNFFGRRGVLPPAGRQQGAR